MVRKSEGARGGWRRGMVKFLKNDEGDVDAFSVGPQNVNLDGSNYRSAAGASYTDIIRATNRAIDTGAQKVYVQTMIRSGSQPKVFRWISSPFSTSELLTQTRRAQALSLDIAEFATRLHDAYPINLALTWTIVPSI